MRILLTAVMGFAILAFLMTGENPLYLLHQAILARDPGYADAVFKDRVAFGRALSSIAHADDGCAVPVVQLYDAPAANPPRAAYGPAVTDRFGGWWRNTPSRLRPPARHELLETCRAQIDAGTAGSGLQAITGKAKCDVKVVALNYVTPGAKSGESSNASSSPIAIANTCLNCGNIETLTKS